MAATLVARRQWEAADRLHIEVDVQHLSTDTQAAIRAAADGKVGSMNQRHPKPITFVSARWATSGTTRLSTLTYRRDL